MTGGWLEEIGRQLRGVGDVLLDEVRAGGLLPLLEPVAPFNRPGLAGAGDRRGRPDRRSSCSRAWR